MLLKDGIVHYMTIITHNSSLTRLEFENEKHALVGNKSNKLLFKMQNEKDNYLINFLCG